MSIPYNMKIQHYHASLGGSLNENDPHGLMYLIAWLPVGGAVWEGLGEVALLAEVCHWGWALGFKRLVPCPVSLCLCLSLSLSLFHLWI